MKAARIEECMRLLREFEALLGEESEALAGGNLARAAAATFKKEKVIARLRELDLEELGEAARNAAGTMEALGAKQEENATLLRTMAQRVGEELSGLRARRSTLRAYGKPPSAGGAAFLNGRA